VRARLWVVRRVAPSHHVGALCLIEHEGRLLMLRQSHRWGWTLPGGLLDRGEAAEATARREVAEETGLEVEPALPFGVVVDTEVRRVDVLFWVPVDHRPPVAAASEALEAAWLTAEEAGAVDESTAQALRVFHAFRRPGAHAGRLAGPQP
jgi:ADP-ribose pyrophosphatase YjhB (NUDIX family)